MSYVIEEFDCDKMELLKDDWIKLECGYDMTAFQSYDWNKLLLEEYRSSYYNRITGRVVFFVVKEQLKTIAIFPAIIQNIGIKIKSLGRDRGIYFLGEGSYSDYMNFVYNDISDSAINEMLIYIKNKYKMDIILNYVREDVGIFDILKKNKEVIVNWLDVSKYVDVSAYCEKEDYYLSLSKSNRQNYRTAKNRLIKNELSYEFSIERGIQDDLDALDTMELLHLKRIHSINVMNEQDILRKIFGWIRYWHKKRVEKKYNIARRAQEVMNVSWTLKSKIDGKIVGYCYGLLDSFNGKHNVRIMQNCFDESYKFYSPTYIAIVDGITSVIDERSIDIIDFTRGAEEYKNKLNCNELVLYKIII